MRFLLTLALIALFAFLLGRAVDTEIASGQPQATARSLLYPRHRPLEQMSLPQLERFQVRAHAHYRGALAAHEKAASRRALSRVEWTHRRWYAAAVGWTSRELAETRARLRPPLGPSWLVNGFLCIHRYEGAWNANTGNGYFGGLQMDYSFMATYGLALLRAKGTADRWTPGEQIAVAIRAYESGRGWGPWPNTRLRCGL